ncbi:hypothetical protein [uncultured Desulfobacter sp.]|uniref:hypothetical protein n=1 Tax=uncultured Desulfobacter sp. TaxID=240139 RepID=UPI0029F56DBB|nr:hypothetical protein [uncultured Desulfobacter sp.]
MSELIDYIKQQGDMIQKLKDELAKLKGQKVKPKIKPSNKDYVINDAAIEYIKQQRLPKFQLEKFQKQCFSTERNWKSFLFQNKIRKNRHKRIATEGAFLGSLIDHGWNKDLAIISDDAGQFNILTYALCWVHAKKTIQKLIGFTQKRKDQSFNQKLCGEGLPRHLYKY